MPRLYRPHIPLEVRCRVALRQLGEMWPDECLAVWPSKKQMLDGLLARLAPLLGCEVKDLRLDHDPALATRQQFKNGRGEIVRYVPAANDPEHLFYRPHGPQFAGSHLIKTNVRGDHGQHPDRVLIKRERRRLKKAHSGAHKKGRKMAKRRKWPSRPLVSRGFPPKGSRPFRRKPR